MKKLVRIAALVALIGFAGTACSSVTGPDHVPDGGSGTIGSNNGVLGGGNGVLGGGNGVLGGGNGTLGGGN